MWRLCLLLRNLNSEPHLFVRQVSLTTFLPLELWLPISQGNRGTEMLSNFPKNTQLQRKPGLCPDLYDSETKAQFDSVSCSAGRGFFLWPTCPKCTCSWVFTLWGLHCVKCTFSGVCILLQRPEYLPFNTYTSYRLSKDCLNLFFFHMGLDDKYFRFWDSRSCSLFNSSPESSHGKPVNRWPWIHSYKTLLITVQAVFNP